MPYKSTAWAPEAWEYIRAHWPYLNRSIAAGQTRHFITHTCDQGPSSCEYAERTLTEGKVPAYWNPAAKDRVVGAPPNVRRRGTRTPTRPVLQATCSGTGGPTGRARGSSRAWSASTWTRTFR